MEPIHSISIPTTEKTSSYTLYHIQVKLCDARILSLSKRFSDFYAFNQLLLEQIKLLENTPSSIDAPPVALPPKDIGVLWKSNNTAFIESRRLGLENYLTALLYSKDYRWRRTPAWLEFLSVPKDLQSQSRNDNAVFALVPSVSPSKQIIINYENWLTEYSKAQEWVREIRKCIRERDRLVGANSGQAVAASQVAINNAKRLLDTLDIHIKTLSDCLKENSNTSTKTNWVFNWVEQQKDVLKHGLSISDDIHEVKKSKQSSGIMSQGEVQRRWDMLSNLTKEHDELKKAISIPSNITDSSFSADRASLLSLGNSKSTSSSGRRKFGVVQETDETRPLDNSQLLSLQNDLMNQQDDALLALSSVIQRQKQIGLAIGQELDHHNVLLENVDESLTRVQNNLKSGDKKLKKILKG